MGDTEVRKEDNLSIQTHADVPSTVQRVYEYLSDWDKIVKSVEWLQRFVSWKIKDENNTGSLSKQDYESAHNIII